MRHLSIIILFSFMTYFSTASNGALVSKEGEHCATCSPNGNCRACTSCNYCKHCNAGGSCSVCAKGAKNSLPEKRSVKSDSGVSAACKATTKKGARCKRMAKAGSYCWQHSK